MSRRPPSIVLSPFPLSLWVAEPCRWASLYWCLSRRSKFPLGHQRFLQSRTEKCEEKKPTEKLSLKFESNKRCAFFFFLGRATPIISLVSREWNSCESLLSWQTFVSRTKADALGGFQNCKDAINLKQMLYAAHHKRTQINKKTQIQLEKFSQMMITSPFLTSSRLPLMFKSL